MWLAQKAPNDVHVAIYTTAPVALAAGAPILTANPKVRVSVIWLAKRNPLQTHHANPLKGGTMRLPNPPNWTSCSHFGENTAMPPAAGLPLVALVFVTFAAVAYARRPAPRAD